MFDKRTNETDKLSAEDLIKLIASESYELSPSKILIQRNRIKDWCQTWVDNNSK